MQTKTINEVASKLDACSSRIEIKSEVLDKIKGANQAKKEEGKVVKKEVSKLMIQMNSLVEKHIAAPQKKSKLEQRQAQLQTELAKIKDTIRTMSDTKANLIAEATKLKELESKLALENSSSAPLTPSMKKPTVYMEEFDVACEENRINSAIVKTGTNQESCSPLSKVMDTLHFKLDSINTEDQTLSTKITDLESELKAKHDELAELAEGNIAQKQDSASDYVDDDEDKLNFGRIEKAQLDQRQRIQSADCIFKTKGEYEAKLQELEKHINIKTETLQQKKQTFKGRVSCLLEEIKKAEADKNAENKKEEVAMAEAAKSEAKVKELKEELDKLKNTIQQSDDKINDLLVNISKPEILI